MKLNLDHYKILGVINITPNSFSDGGLNLDPDFLLNTLHFFSSNKKLIWDIGAESTAPMNSKISQEEELNRFRYFFNLIKEKKMKLPKVISIDTYKFDVMKEVYFEIKKLSPKTQIIFNDVSGVVDDELLSFLSNYKDLAYVYCFTKNVGRENVHDHMKNVKASEDIVMEMMESFYRVSSLFKIHHLENELILDPCFGFSKTLDENWKIIDDFSRVLKIKKQMKLNHPILIGVSKKSFIHKLIDSNNPKEDSEFIHYKIISEFHQLDTDQIIYRVHNPVLVQFALG